MNNSIPFTATATDTALISNNQSGIVEFDVTSDIQSFVGEVNQNYGWIVVKTNESQSGKVGFGTKESQYSPKLIITLN